MMAQDAQSGKEIMGVLAKETVNRINRLMFYQTYMRNYLKSDEIQENERPYVNELYDAIFTVPERFVGIARARCLDVIRKLKREERAEANGEASAESQGFAHREMTSTVRYQDEGINSLARSRKQHYRIMAKRKACKTSRKHALIKLQSGESRSSSKKNSKYANLANSGETSQVDTEDVQPKNFPKKRRLNKKSEEMNDGSGSKSDVRSSVPVKKTKSSVPVKKTRSSVSVKKTAQIKKKKGLNHSISNSNDECKSLVIKLIDFMTDVSVNDDPYIAQYKQANCHKISEVQVVDVIDDDLNQDQKAESFDNSGKRDDDNQEEKISPKSRESKDKLEQDSAASKSTISEEENIEPPRKAISNGKKGPCASFSSDPVEYISRRGHCTPSLSPPATRRGPRTTPGLAPTSDSEGHPL